MLFGLCRGSGVIVAARTTWASSIEVGLATRDVIHSVNRSTIITLEALQSAIHRLQPGDPVVLQVERAGRLQFVAFEME